MRSTPAGPAPVPSAPSGRYVLRSSRQCGSPRRRSFLRAQQADRFPVAVDRPDVHIGLAGANTHGLAAFGKPGIDQRADILVATSSLAPELVEIGKDGSGHLECTPDPGGLRIG